MDQLKNIIRILRVFIIRIMASFKPEMSLPQTAIIIAPHPDDEVFGCCGLMQRMLAEGKRVELVIMTGGGKSHAYCCSISEADLIAKRRQLTLNAATLYGLSKEYIHFMDYPDGGVQYNNANTKELECVLSGIEKSVACKNVAVFYPHSVGEGWSDHLCTSEIVRQLSTSIIPNAKQYEYCVWFWFYNCWKIDWKSAFTHIMSRQEYNTKLNAINSYIEPKAPCGNPWSGVLPPVFLWANKGNRELFFRVK